MGSYVSSLIPQPDSEITVMPFKNKQIEAIAKKFLLSPHDMIFLHEIFRKMSVHFYFRMLAKTTNIIGIS